MSVKDIEMKNHTYYLFDDIININDFGRNNNKIHQKSYKIILIYYICYVTIKKDLRICSANPLYLIFGKVNGYFEEINGNELIALVPTNESKKKYGEIWSKIRDLIRTTTKNYYDEKYIKVKFNSEV